MTAEIVQSLVSGLLMGLIYALVAAGLSLIFGLMDVVNFAHGEMLMLAMYAAVVVFGATGLDPLLQLPIVCLVMFALGWGVYRGIIARALGVRFNRGMVQIFATFGLAILFAGRRNLPLAVTSGAFRTPGSPTGRSMRSGSMCRCRSWRRASFAWWRSPGCC